MPDELFLGVDCPICVMTKRNILHGLDLMTPLQGEQASNMVGEAWQYYRPKVKDPYGNLKTQDK